MKFLQLTICNFGPYKGSQIVDFPTDPEKPVIVVFGENMRGKTTLLNSVRWVLYGRALDRQWKVMDSIKLLNSDSHEEGDYQFSVSLKFEADDSVFEITRTSKPLDLIGVPRKDSDFQSHVLMRKDGHSLPSDNIRHEVNRFFPEDIARFYLFDAELLGQYETLLLEDSTQQRAIKESIEQILGVPALLRARDDLNVLLKKAQHLLAREVRHDGDLESYSNHSLQLQEEIKVHERDLENLEKQLEDCNEEIDKIDLELSETTAIQASQTKMSVLERDLVNVKQRELDSIEDRKSALKGAWKDLLQPRLQYKHAEITTRIQEHQKEIKLVGSLEVQIEQLRHLLEMNDCSVCGQLIAESQREKYGEQLGDLEARAKRAEFDSADVGRLSEERNMINKISSTNALVLLRILDKKLAQSTLAITSIESEIENLKEDLRGHDLARVAQLQRKKDGYLELRGSLLVETKGTRKLIDEKNSKVGQLSKLMVGSSSTRKNRNSRQVEIYTALATIFARSVDKLRDRMRQRVATEATNAFLELITEKTYKELSINSNYGLTIIDQNNRAVPIRSSGAEEIVALSLLSALNKTTNRKGPVIIDTPFGRLDPSHRLNILNFVPKMANQVVFLVHGGEIDRTTGLEPVADTVGARYEIERITSSRSIIRKIEV